MSYGFSLWLVFDSPSRLIRLLAKYNRKPHIPHVTVKTNMESLEEAQKTLLCYKHWRDTVTITKPSQKFGKMYKNDPLSGWGFPATLRNIHIEHKPHLTVAYNNEAITGVRFPLHEEARLKIADTRSENPWEWIVF